MDWLAAFNIEELDEASILWTKMFACCCNYLMKLNKNKKDKEALAGFTKEMLKKCYVQYNTEEPLVENIKRNLTALETNFPEFKECVVNYENQSR